MKTSRPAPAGAGAGVDAKTLQESLAAPPEGSVPAAAIDDPIGLFAHLEASGRFHRDTGLGRIFHPGSISFRENVANDSLHVLIRGNLMSAHVDRVSPLGLRPERGSRYSPGPVALHNLSGMATELGRLLRGRQGDHRSELFCRWTSCGEGAVEPAPEQAMPLLDPEVAQWSVHLEARIAGSLDEQRLRRALASTAPGHESLSVVDCPDDASLARARADLQALAVPAREQPPLLSSLARHPDGDVLMLNVNHAAADGPGAVEVLYAVARAYANHPARMPPLDFLAVRDLPVEPAPRNMHSAVQLYRSALERARNLVAPPVRLVAERAGGAPGHGFHLVTVERDDPANLVHVRNRDKDNVVLLAALHLAIAAWNAERGERDGRISVLVPVDLRWRPWPDGAIGNFSVTARISTSRRHRTSPAVTRKTIATQTARNIRTRTGTALIEALDRAGLLPLWARQSLVVLQPFTGNHLVDSAVLSYLGRVEQVPSFGAEAGEVQELWMSTPTRMPQGLSVGAATLGGRLHIAFRYPHRLFDQDAAHRFADLFLAQLGLVIGSHSLSATSGAPPIPPGRPPGSASPAPTGSPPPPGSRTTPAGR